VKSKTALAFSVALTLLISLVAALGALAASGGHASHDHATHTHATASISRQELALRNEMRRLWEDHVVWTRMAIVSLTAGSPDTEATVARLLRNQADIGNAVKPFYGNAAGNALTALLRDHILIAADVIAAAKAGHAAELADAQSRWSKNANEIAGLLAKANPRYWKRSAVEHMLAMHLQLTTEEAVARLQGNWAADVAAYDEVHRHALGMADLLATGLVKQFPRRFRAHG
jgi:hypothetical protein